MLNMSMWRILARGPLKARTGMQPDDWRIWPLKSLLKADPLLYKESLVKANLL